MDVSPAHAPTGELAKRVSTVATAAATFLVVGLVLLYVVGLSQCTALLEVVLPLVVDTQGERRVDFNPAALWIAGLPATVLCIALGLLVPCCGYLGSKWLSSPCLLAFTGCSCLQGLFGFWYLCSYAMWFAMLGTAVPAVEVYLQRCDPAQCFEQATGGINQTIDCFATALGPDYKPRGKGYPHLTSDCPAFIACGPASEGLPEQHWEAPPIAPDGSILEPSPRPQGAQRPRPQGPHDGPGLRPHGPRLGSRDKTELTLDMGDLGLALANRRLAAQAPAHGAKFLKLARLARLARVLGGHGGTWDMADMHGGGADAQGPVDAEHCRVRAEMARKFHEAPAVVEEGAPLVGILIGAVLLFLAPFVVLSGLGCFTGTSLLARLASGYGGVDGQGARGIALGPEALPARAPTVVYPQTAYPAAYPAVSPPVVAIPVQAHVPEHLAAVPEDTTAGPSAPSAGPAPPVASTSLAQQFVLYTPRLDEGQPGGQVVLSTPPGEAPAGQPQHFVLATPRPGEAPPEQA